MLSEALRLIRVFHDMKQTELAQRLGISKSYLSEIESGKKPPRMDLIERYVSEFDIPSSVDFVFRRGPRAPICFGRGCAQGQERDCSQGHLLLEAG